MDSDIEFLLSKIERNRKELNELLELTNHNYTDTAVVEASQELDDLLLRFQRLVKNAEDFIEKLKKDQQ